jgi:uncharacterized protein with FMN-binding domain
MEPTKKLNPGLIALIVVALIAIVATAVIVINNNSKTAENDEAVPTQDTSDSSSDSKTSTTSEYKNGTYTATGNYSTPGGQESIELTVTLTDGAITDASLKEMGKTGEAKQYQGEFASGYKALTVGKKIDDVSLSRVAGSSLTSNGFNEALEQIKEDATA